MLSWTKHYNKSNLKGDIFAGITTGVMLIPQGMAYALIAGLPPIYGLYAALIPPFVYSLFGTSYQLSVGPVATGSLLVFAGLSELNFTGEEFVLAASLLALLVGSIQFIFGLSRLGFIVNFLSRPVISGYTSAAALIIAFSQIKNLLGIGTKTDSRIYNVVLQTVKHIEDTHLPTFAFGIGAIAFLLIMKKLNRRLPSSIFVVMASIIIVYAFQLEEKLHILGTIPSGLPSFRLPFNSLSEIKDLLPLSLIIALVGFLESISIGKTMQTRHKDHIVNANAELIALGLANIIGSLFKAFPSSGGFARSAVNEQAGAKSPLAIMIGSSLIALTLVFLTPVFYYLPKSVLAAIIMVAVVKLIDLKEAVVLWKISKRDFLMMITTLIVTLGFGIQEGIVTGVLLSLALVIYKSTYPHTALLGKLPDSNYYRNLDRFPEALDREDAVVFRFDAQLYFANIQYFIDKLSEHIDCKGNQLKVVVINAQAINGLDMSAVYGLQEFLYNLKNRGLVIYFTEAIGPVRDIMKKSGLYDLIGKEHFHMRVQDALDHFDNHLQKNTGYALQTNE